jgi:hypothetical protein
MMPGQRMYSRCEVQQGLRSRLNTSSVFSLLNTCSMTDTPGHPTVCNLSGLLVMPAVLMGSEETHDKGDICK